MAAFSHNFLWSTATVTHQVGGGHDADGKGLSIWNVYSHLPGTTFKDITGDVVADHYHRFREDVTLIAETDLQSYQLPISWPRLLLAGCDEANEVGVQFYSDLIDKLLAYNIKPVITLYHWDLPQALQDEGDWEACTTAEVFAGYARLRHMRLGPRVKLWVIFNETIVLTGYSYINSLHSLTVCDPVRAIQACHHVFIAHTLAAKAFRKMNMMDEIGFVNVLQPHASFTDNETDKEATELADATHTHWPCDLVLRGTYPTALLTQTQTLWEVPCFAPDDDTLLCENRCSFIELNYYRRETMPAQPPNIPTGGEPGMKGLFYFTHDPQSTYTEWEWEIWPQGLTDGIMMIRERYGDVPIYIIENDLGAKNPIIAGEVVDDPRIDYLSSHIGALEKALVLGMDVRGYYPRSFIDLLSWLSGYQKQYGSVYADHQQNPVRRRKKSFYRYKSVIASHGEQR